MTSDPTPGRPRGSGPSREPLPARDAARVMIGLSAVGLALAWGLLLQGMLRHAAHELAVSDIRRAERILEDAREGSSQRLRTFGRVLAEDPRLKSIMTLQRVDRATLQDSLAELRALTTLDMLALLDAAGSVRAVSGMPALQDRDLAGSSALSAEGSTAKPAPRTSWMLEEGVFDVAARPLRLGEQLFGHLLLGLKLGPEVLARVKLLSRVDAALVVDRKLVLGTAGMTGSALLAFKLDAEPLSVLLDGEPTAAALVPLNPEDPRMQALLFVDEGRSSGPLLRLGRVCWIPSIICVLFGLVLLWRERLPR